MQARIEARLLVHVQPAAKFAGIFQVAFIDVDAGVVAVEVGDQLGADAALFRRR